MQSQRIAAWEVPGRRDVYALIVTFWRNDESGQEDQVYVGLTRGTLVLPDGWTTVQVEGYLTGSQYDLSSQLTRLLDAVSPHVNSEAVKLFVKTYMAAWDEHRLMTERNPDG